MAVNVSPVQFRRAGFLRAGAARAAADPESTRHGWRSRSPKASCCTRPRRRSPRCAGCAALGVSIAMDDFGTGYSSLGYLQKFRFDKIKIDRSFVSALQTDPHAAEIVRAVLRMSHAMGIRVNAEGVEHEQQASMLPRGGLRGGAGLPVRPRTARHRVLRRCWHRHVAGWRRAKLLPPKRRGQGEFLSSPGEPPGTPPRPAAASVPAPGSSASRPSARRRSAW